MQIQPTNPIADPNGGEPFRAYLLTMAISPLIQDATIAASVAVRLMPFRVNTDGSLDTLPDQEQIIVYGDAFKHAENDADLAQTMMGILEGVQSFVTAKGL